MEGTITTIKVFVQGRDGAVRTLTIEPIQDREILSFFKTNILIC